MKKLKLDLNSVTVESFVTVLPKEGGATVHGYQDLNPFAVAGEPYQQVYGSNYNSCPTDGCGTCFHTCWQSCDVSCPGTSGMTEP